MDVKWQRGNYLQFYSYMKIRIGSKDNIVDAIHQGDTFEFDGTMLRYAGAEIAQPSLRGAIKQDWAGPTPDRQQAIAARVPARKVAKSQTVNRDLSRVQRNVDEAVMETDSLDEETVLQVGDRGKIEQKQSPRALTASDNRRGIQMSMDDMQDGQVVGRVRSPAKLKANVLDPANRNLARSIENRGVGRPSMIEREGITIETNVGNMDPTAVVAEEEDGTIVAQVRHSERGSTEGISVEDTSNVRKRKPAKRAQATESQDDVKSKKSKVRMSPKLRIALKVYPDFPHDWNFYAKSDEKLSRIDEMGADPDFLDALYASESTSMKKVLESRFPRHFS